jgi:hypothetical protein
VSKIAGELLDNWTRLMDSMGMGASCVHALFVCWAENERWFWDLNPETYLSGDRHETSGSEWI